MGSHSVTCHLTEVRIPPLPPAEAGEFLVVARQSCLLIAIHCLLYLLTYFTTWVPPVDSIAVMIVIIWRFGGKIIRTVLCCVVFDSYTQ